MNACYLKTFTTIDTIRIMGSIAKTIRLVECWEGLIAPFAFIDDSSALTTKFGRTDT